MISLLLAASAFSSRPSLPQDPPQQLTAQKERLIDQLLPEETPKRFYWNDGNDEYHDGYGWDLRDDDEIRIDGGIIAEGDACSHSRCTCFYRYVGYMISHSVILITYRRLTRRRRLGQTGADISASQWPLP